MFPKASNVRSMQIEFILLARVLCASSYFIFLFSHFRYLYLFPLLLFSCATSSSEVSWVWFIISIFEMLCECVIKTTLVMYGAFIENTDLVMPFFMASLLVATTKAGGMRCASIGIFYFICYLYCVYEFCIMFYKLNPKSHNVCLSLSHFICIYTFGFGCHDLWIASNRNQ